MQLEDIRYFFTNPPPIYLCREQAVCYILSVLIQGESCGTGMIQQLECEYGNYRLSDTILYGALEFLESEGAICGSWRKGKGRGRPRRIYQLNPAWHDEARKLAALWRYFTTQQRQTRLSGEIRSPKRVAQS
ncbi:period-extender protein [Chroococcidiopsis cubana SAG 39.79]|uniref:Period-extender protein n=1 Tax=Chroococcidiopsis cubana SAG 39.79 TaxID=388085 RepID=A0AB37U836_9CYAN|nr:PadR family transcriptional regulator [Chroococcidiopsis cubana]RUS93322.1 period-extender protein [Chroococcidiopsis cubana SAG 39.79]